MGIREGCCGLRAWGWAGLDWAGCGCCGFVLTVSGSSGAGWTQLRWGGQQAPGTRETRGEGADLGEGLAAADKQEAAAHGLTVAADRVRARARGGMLAAPQGPSPAKGRSPDVETHGGGQRQLGRPTARPDVPTAEEDARLGDAVARRLVVRRVLRRGAGGRIRRNRAGPSLLRPRGPGDPQVD